MINWITKYLGTAAYKNTNDSSGYVRVDVRSLVDRAGNAENEIRPIIENVLNQLRQGNKVVVCCDHGISRSNSIATAVLSIYEKISFFDALRIVMQKTGIKDIRVEVLNAVRRSIGIQDRGMDENNWLILGGQGRLGRAVIDSVPDTVTVLAPRKNEINLLDGQILLDIYIKENSIGRVLYFASPHILNINQSVGDSIVMLKNVLDACVSNMTPLLIVSRWEVFSGYKGHDVSLNEESECKPDGVIGYMTYLCESLVLQCSERNSLPIIILRSALLYGNNMAPNFVNYITSKARCNDVVKIHRYINGYAKVDVLHIDDWLSACFSLLEKNVSGIFHVGGELMSLHDIASISIKVIGSKSIIKDVEIDDEVACIGLDSAKLLTLTGWHKNNDFSTGIAEYCENVV